MLTSMDNSTNTLTSSIAVYLHSLDKVNRFNVLKYNLGPYFTFHMAVTVMYGT